MLKKIFLPLCFFVLFNFSNAHANTGRLLIGKIVDSERNDPIGGATIKIVGTNKGGYSSGSGTFRLQIPEGSNKLKISSIGYENKTVEIKNFRDTILIKLKASPITLNGAQAFGDITAEEVVRRAIKKRDENAKKIKTFNGLLYSKLVMELDGSIANSAFAGANSISISASPDADKAKAEAFKMFVLESFSKYYVDYEKDVKKTYIQQRKQTGNIPANSNILALTEFNDFLNTKISIMDATFITPMHTSSPDYYEYKIINKTMSDDRYVYNISVTPKSTLVPLFKGNISIVEGTYNLVNIDLSPSESSAITFVEDLNFKEKFEEITPGIWYPGLFEVTAKAKVDVIKGLMDLGVNFKATAIFHETNVNGPLPDSIYKDNNIRLSVDSKADSTDAKFWEDNSLREITPRELQMYSKIDTAVKKLDTVLAKNSKFNYSLLPDFQFNRVMGYGLGINFFGKVLNTFDFQISPVYSFGHDRVFGDFSLSSTLNSGGLRITPKLNYSFGIINQGEKPYPRLATDLIALFAHKDYYDYYYKNGGGFELEARYKDLEINVLTEFNDVSNLNIYGNKSLFTDKTWRNNPDIIPGYVRFSKLSFKFADAFTSFYSDGTINYGLSASIFYGELNGKSGAFRGADAKAKLNFPILNTGYAPINLDLIAKAGLASNNVPIQYQFRPVGDIYLFKNDDAIITAPFGKFGGTEYVEAHGRLNLGDIWWRALGLPTYYGRGIDLSLTGSAARYINNSTTTLQGNPRYLTEVGFGLSRIPTFVSNVAFLSVDFKWGVGPDNAGNFGFCLGISLPF